MNKSTNTNAVVSSSAESLTDKLQKVLQKLENREHVLYMKGKEYEERTRDNKAEAAAVVINANKKRLLDLNSFETEQQSLLRLRNENVELIQESFLKKIKAVDTMCSSVDEVELPEHVKPIVKKSLDRHVNAVMGYPVKTYVYSKKDEGDVDSDDDHYYRVARAFEDNDDDDDDGSSSTADSDDEDPDLRESALRNAVNRV